MHLFVNFWRGVKASLFKTLLMSKKSLTISEKKNVSLIGVLLGEKRLERFSEKLSNFTFFGDGKKSQKIFIPLKHKRRPYSHYNNITTSLRCQ